MHVIEVIPLGRGQHMEALSYFSLTPYREGTLLSIPVRTRVIQGVVLSSKEVSAAKAALRSATFSLRRLPTQKTLSALPQALLETATILSEYYAAQKGAVLFSLLPKEIRNGTITIDVENEIPQKNAVERETVVLRAPTLERIEAYKRIVRASFANKESVTIVVPSIEDGILLKETLGSGIKKYVVTLNSNETLRSLRTSYTHIKESDHPLLIITTPHYAFLGRNDTGTVIIERSRSFVFRQRTKPYIDFRHALMTYATCRGVRLLTGDTLTRSEDEHLLRTEKAVAYDEHPKRITLPGKINTVMMTETSDGKTPFVLFSDTLLSRIEKNRKEKGQIFLFSARRGLAPVVACVDCGTMLRCPKSGSPLALHRTFKNGIETRTLISSVSGYSRPADSTCSVCGSWRLRERGIGIQHVYDELTALFPKEDIFIFDHETAKTHRKATHIRDEFYKKKGGILLGTALALPYLHNPISCSAVVSMDSLRAIPSWRQQEEALGTLLSLREITDGPVILQTRAEDDGLIEHAKKGSLTLYHDEELALRKRFSYPPFSVFIHLTWKIHARDTLSDDITTRFEEFSIHIYDAPNAEDATRYGLMRIPYEHWPKDDLVDALRALPPSVRIVINPDRLL